MADIQTLFSEGIRGILKNNKHYDYVFSWSVTSGEELLTKVASENVELLIMDLCLYEIDGIDLIDQLKQKYPEMRILIFTQYAQSKFIKEAFLKGADGYLLKSDTSQNLFKAIETVLNGETFMGGGISIGPKNNLSLPGESEKWASEDPFFLKHELTLREREILSEICDGKTNKEIASELFISDQTVCVHKKNIMKKFNVNSSQKLKLLAKSYNLTQLSSA